MKEINEDENYHKRLGEIFIRHVEQKSQLEKELDLLNRMKDNMDWYENQNLPKTFMDPLELIKKLDDVDFKKNISVMIREKKLKRIIHENL